MKVGGRHLVFLGPTLPLEEARGLIDAEFLPPVQMGDLYRVLAERPRSVVLIDGYFYGRPAVWQREILALLAEGIPVFGASSMGALRARELDVWGMVGRGEVYARFARDEIDGDDEVALLHGDASVGYRPFSVPLVNARATLAAAEEAGLVAPAERAELVAALKALPFNGRSYEAVLGHPLITGGPARRRRDLEAFLASREVDLKAEDARELLRYVAAGNGAGPAAGPPAPPEEGWHFGQQRVLQRRLRAGGTGGGIDFTGADLFRGLVGRPALFTGLWQRVQRRAFLLLWAARTGFAASGEECSAGAAQHRLNRGYDDRDEWLADQGMTGSEFDRALVEMVTADRLLDRPLALSGVATAVPERFAAGFTAWRSAGAGGAPSDAWQANLLQRLRETAIHRAWLDAEGLDAVPGGPLEAAVEAWERDQGISDRGALLEVCGLDGREYRRLHEDRECSRWMVAQGVHRFGYLRPSAEERMLWELQMGGELGAVVHELAGGRGGDAGDG